MLFDSPPVQLRPDVWLLPGFAPFESLSVLIDGVVAHCPLRQLTTPMGGVMAVAMSNCGALGWTSDSTGYRYTGHDPLTQLAWPAMPGELTALATRAAACVGWPGFEPDACLINHYRVGAGMGLHQDHDEHDQSQPIVSVSLGGSCKFMVGGLARTDPVRSVALHDGDVVVWGASARLMHHGVRPVTAERWNLTFRRAG